MSKKEKCPTCGRRWVPPKKIIDALRLVKAGIRPSAAARFAGISRQLLHHHMKIKALSAQAEGIQ